MFDYKSATQCNEVASAGAQHRKSFGKYQFDVNRGREAIRRYNQSPVAVRDFVAAPVRNRQVENQCVWRDSHDSNNRL